jgi:hypothetical protein
MDIVNWFADQGPTILAIVATALVVLYWSDDHAGDVIVPNPVRWGGDTRDSHGERWDHE